MSSIRVFRTFMEVVQKGSFAAASEHVSLTPAAVGLQIQNLEIDLGYPLFDRVGKSIALNRRGHQLIPHVQHILRIYEGMSAHDPDQMDLTGSIKVASIATSMGLVLRAVLRLRAKYPMLAVEPGISYSGDLVARVKTGEYDAAISVRNAHKAPAGVVWTHLYREPLVFVSSSRATSKNKPASIHELLSKRLFLRVSKTSNTGTLIDEFMRRSHLKINEFLEMNAMRTMIDLIKDDLGVAIMPIPRGEKWDDDPKLKITRFNDSAAFRNIGIFEKESSCFLTSVLRECLLGELALEDAVVTKNEV